MRSLRAALFALALVMPLHAADALAGQEAPATRTMSADAMLDSIAVNTHITYTDGAYADLQKVADDLAWLGVRHIREGTPGGSAIPLSSYLWLARRGVKFDFVVHGDLDDSLRELDRFVAAAPPGSVSAVEGYNEIDNFPMHYLELTGEAAGLAAQRALYEHVHGISALAGVAVYDLTGFDPARVAARTGSADFANQHPYPQNGDQPAHNAMGPAWIAWAVDGVRKYSLPVVLTEFGYFTIPQAGWLRIGVDEPTQAKGVLNGLFEAARLGVTRTYIYELLDEKLDPQNTNGEMHFGLFRNDDTPKAAASTIRNLTTILGTHGKTGALANNSPSYSLTGMRDTGRSLLLTRAPGHYLIALWNVVPFWDRAAGKPLNAPPVSVQVDFGARASRVSLYDPTSSAAPLAHHEGLQRLTVDVPDHVILVDVTMVNAP
ncbi:calcium-binding protein [Paraburkholderia sp. EG285A]|uniref:calcium-binding protein n=1 Tax=Paraburkholderia sp. EG285A TaxID=3237009 RepID=UPI0034D29EDD